MNTSTVSFINIFSKKKRKERAIYYFPRGSIGSHPDDYLGFKTTLASSSYNL